MLLSRKDCPDGLRIDLSPLRFDLNDNRFWVILGTWGLGNPNPDGTQTWSSVASLRSIDLTRKAILTTWQGEISFKNGVRLTSIVSSNDAVYVSTYGGGLLEFRKNYVGGQEFIEKPKILTRDNSVPSVFITDMIGEGSRLRIAYGGENKESGLGLYDPETGNWETVFCSSLKGDTPFNAGQPYCINSLTRVNPNKLFFIASGIEQSGFWKMDTISKELKYLGPVGSSTITRFDDIVEALGEKILIKSISSLVEFDTDSEEMKVIYGDHRVLRVEFLRKNINPPDYENMLKPTLLRGMTFGPYYVGHIDLSTSTFHNNKLWARLGESQIIIVGKGESLEEARIIDNDILDGEPVSRFVSTPYGLVAIGNGTVGLIDTK